MYWLEPPNAFLPVKDDGKCLHIPTSTLVRKLPLRLTKSNYNAFYEISKWRSEVDEMQPILKLYHAKLVREYSDGTSSLLTIFVQNYCLTLAQINAIPLSLASDILLQIILAVQKLQKQFGSFQIDARQIVLTQHSWKMWPNSIHSSQKTISLQHNMCQKLINLIQQHTVKNEQSKRFFQDLQINETHKSIIYAIKENKNPIKWNLNRSKSIVLQKKEQTEYQNTLNPQNNDKKYKKNKKIKKMISNANTMADSNACFSNNFTQDKLSPYVEKNKKIPTLIFESGIVAPAIKFFFTDKFANTQRISPRITRHISGLFQDKIQTMKSIKVGSDKNIILQSIKLDKLNKFGRHIEIFEQEQ